MNYKKNTIFLHQLTNLPMQKLLTILACFVSIALSAQNGKTETFSPKTSYYSFKIENVTDADKLNLCSQEALLVKGVTEAKIKFKSELKLAELIIAVSEKPRQSEGEEEFSLAEIKKIIIRNGLSPAGFVILN